MPCSMDACRTVLPFSTVTWRPSMLRVTPFSITQRSYQQLGAVRVNPFSTRTPLFDDVRQRGAVPIGLDAADRTLELDRLLDRLVGDADNDVLRRAVRIRHR